MKKGFKPLRKMLRKSVRWCGDIGMFALDRSKSSCKFRSKYCTEHCYNIKLYRAFGHGMYPKDQILKRTWGKMRLYPQAAGRALNNVLWYKTKDTTRFRLCTRGEAITDDLDITLLENIAEANPDTRFWVPTRAWSDAELRKQIESRLIPRENIFIQASFDPSTSKPPNGWPTMFFGDNTRDKGVRCPKTFKKAKGICGLLCNYCFDKKSHVLLKEH